MRLREQCSQIISPVWEIKTWEHLGNQDMGIDTSFSFSDLFDF